MNSMVQMKSQDSSSVDQGICSPTPEDGSSDDDDYSKYFGCKFRLNMGRTPTPEDCASDDEVVINFCGS